MKRRFGFTLIELVMVIVILGILASVTLPKFVNFKARAIENTEASIFGAMNTAVKIQYTANVVAGNDSYPDCLPLTMITNVPPYMQFTDGVANDDYHWRYLRWSYYCMMYCPHWNGTIGGGAGGATKGNWYWYIISGTYGQYQTGKGPGDFYRGIGYGH